MKITVAKTTVAMVALAIIGQLAFYGFVFWLLWRLVDWLVTK